MARKRAKKVKSVQKGIELGFQAKRENWIMTKLKAKRAVTRSAVMFLKKSFKKKKKSGITKIENKRSGYAKTGGEVDPDSLADKYWK
jgi:hypothetical protein